MLSKCKYCGNDFEYIFVKKTRYVCDFCKKERERITAIAWRQNNKERWKIYREKQKEYKKQYNKKYKQRSEVKDKEKEYRAKPEIMERRKEKYKKYNYKKLYF